MSVRPYVTVKIVMVQNINLKNLVNRNKKCNIELLFSI